jgi:translation initiation factor 3 subunit L
MSYQTGMAPARAIEDDSDVEEEALVADYKEQVQYAGADMDDLDPGLLAPQAEDIQARLVQAAQPLDYQATLETKFQSYDNYCALFHYILNSEGPVDLEPPSVSAHSCSLLGRHWVLVTDCGVR